jgi:7-cyano-7-deazaguanine synthase in queuosine biosynthesis
MEKGSTGMAALEKTAVVLLSGGLDSATVLAMARSQGYICHALTISYGQRHQVFAIEQALAPAPWRG